MHSRHLHLPTSASDQESHRMLRRRTKSIEDGLHAAMRPKTLPLLLLGACASTAPLPTADQPELARMVESYAQQLQAVGITRVISPGSGAMVRLETGCGSG